MDNEDEEDIADEVDGKNGMVVLSTIIGARTVTLNTVRYAVIHPAVRVSYMHYSGIIQLMETPITRPHCACEVWPRNAFIRRR